MLVLFYSYFELQDDFIPRNLFALLLCIYAVCKVLCFILSDDDFEIKSKIYSLNCLSCFIHILNCKMSLFLGIYSLSCSVYMLYVKYCVLFCLMMTLK